MNQLPQVEESRVFNADPEVSLAWRPLRAGKRNRICIITSAAVCCNPRVVKEADALTQAGYDVRVVASQNIEWAARWDTDLMAGRRWQLDPVRWDGSDTKARWTRLKSGIRQRSFQVASRATNESGICERAFARLYQELLRKATASRADLYMAHNPQALPVAAAAAERFGVSFAFDSEDYHSGEFTDEQVNSPHLRWLCYLESKYLPRCAFITTPSDPISRAIAGRYGIHGPTTIHNVFPWADRMTLDGQVKDRRGDALSLYWYSQIVGLDRGLQDVIRAASLLSTPIQIHLRGDISLAVETELMRLARECSVADRIYFHPPVPPNELLSRAVEHDVGLALEQPVNENRSLTITNKVFFYLLAGLAVAATDTRGQRLVIENCPDAGFLYRPGDYSSLATGLQVLIDSPFMLRRKKAAALEVAQSRWSWEMEGSRLVQLVSSVLGDGN
jgi:glycosyltransferase involved in cell wall biosynthesis